jgi:hypothetical protein
MIIYFDLFRTLSIECVMMMLSFKRIINDDIHVAL